MEKLETAEKVIKEYQKWIFRQKKKIKDFERKNPKSTLKEMEINNELNFIGVIHATLSHTLRNVGFITLNSPFKMISSSNIEKCLKC